MVKINEKSSLSMNELLCILISLRFFVMKTNLYILYVCNDYHCLLELYMYVQAYLKCLFYYDKIVP